MNAIGYLRVSTSEQADHGYGLEVQEQAIKAFCTAHDTELVATHRDIGISGSSNLDQRPGLATALAEPSRV